MKSKISKIETNFTVKSKTMKKITTSISALLFILLPLIGFAQAENRIVLMDSLQQLNTTILQNPTYEGYFMRASILARLGDYTGAAHNYTDAISLNASDKNAYFERGKARYAIGDVKGALPDFEKIIEFDSLIPEYYFNRGLARRVLGNYAGALEDCSKAIELNANYAEAYNLRGLCKYYTGDESALQDYTTAIELNADYADAYNNRGNYYINDDNNKAACADWTKAVELGDNKAKNWIAKYCTTKQEEQPVIQQQETPQVVKEADKDSVVEAIPVIAPEVTPETVVESKPEIKNTPETATELQTPVQKKDKQSPKQKKEKHSKPNSAF